MAGSFDADAVAKQGWRQGAVLGPALFEVARECRPPRIELGNDDLLIVTSHDCDVVNPQLDKEPVVEVLRARPLGSKAPDKQKRWGRHPRALQVVIDEVVVECGVHDRWTVPREALATESPASMLPDKERRVVAGWLAKRYIRAAFPTEFDLRWRHEMKAWVKVLDAQSELVQGVYLRLSTLAELPPEEPYRCSVVVAVPAERRGGPQWADERETLEREVTEFWERFTPKIELDEVEVLGTDEVTLELLETYQRFDADWVSFADDSPLTPPGADLKL
jgi:hypothetical protein